MKKSLIIGAAVVVVAIVAYVGTREEKSPFQTTQAQQASPATVQKLKADGTIPARYTETNNTATEPGTSSGSSSSALPVEQTQNAVDFNAAGAGTAEQKAAAAAAAVKAYKDAHPQH